MYPRSISILHPSLQNRHGLYVMKKKRVEKNRVGKDERERERVEKRVGKDDEKKC